MPPIPWGPSFVYFISYTRALPELPVPWGSSYISLISYPMVLAVRIISHGTLIRISTFIPEGIGSSTNIPGAPHMCLYFHTRGYWRCHQYRGGGAKGLLRMCTSIPKGYLRCRQYLVVPQIYFSLLIALFLETIINIEHINLCIINMNQDIYIWMRVVQRN